MGSEGGPSFRSAFRAVDMGEAVPPPTVRVNGQGITEITPTGTPWPRQRELNTVDVGGNGRTKPAEAAAAAQIEPTVGNMQRYEGAPTSGAKMPDFKIVEGTNAGKTIDFMYTTARLSDQEISGMNKSFEKNMTISSRSGQLPPGVEQIQKHFNKSDFVAMDMRALTPGNQRILINHINTLPLAQQRRILLIK